MTAKEAGEWIGKTGAIPLGGLQVFVRILDVKESYGRTRFQVEPIKGAGTIWVEKVWRVEGALVVKTVEV